MNVYDFTVQQLHAYLGVAREPHTIDVMADMARELREARAEVERVKHACQAQRARVYKFVVICRDLRTKSDVLERALDCVAKRREEVAQENARLRAALEEIKALGERTRVVSLGCNCPYIAARALKPESEETNDTE